MVKSITAVSKGGRRKTILLTVEGLPGNAGIVRVVGMTGEEAISRPFEFRLELATTPRFVGEVGAYAAKLLGAELSVRLDCGNGRERYFHGRTAAVSVDEVEGEQGRERIVLHLRPRLWWLSCNVETRLFTDKTAKEIVSTILTDNGIPAADVEWPSTPGLTFANRPFCWQYREDALSFVSRLLEEEGLTYWFAFNETGHRLILADAPAAYREGSLGPVPRRPANEEKGLASDKADAVTALREIWQVTPAAYARRGLPFEDPAAEVKAEAENKQLGACGIVREGVCTPGEATGERRIAEARAKVLASRAGRVTGAGGVRAFAAGEVVTLAATSPLLPARRLLLTAVRHDIHQGKVTRYHNFFEAAPAEVFYAPPRRHARPVVPGTLAAVVASRPDKHGRVQVKFDADARQTLSAWMPLTHPASEIFIPRIGQRVAVFFADGDPAHPLVGPCLDNADGLPFDPAAHPERGGIVTPHHAIWLDDDKDKRMLLHVQGLLQQLVQGNRVAVVEKDDLELARGNRHRQTDGDSLETIGKNAGRTIGGASADKVTEGYSLDVGKSLLLHSGERIVLTAGGSCIVIDKTGITINGAPLLQLNPKSAPSTPSPTAPASLQAAAVAAPARPAKKTSK